MDPSMTVVALLLLLPVLLIILATGVWIALSLAIVAVLGLYCFASVPVGNLLVSTMWDASWPWALTALPLFIWMGEILFRTRLSEDMFTGLGPWVRWLPGRLLHVNVLGCGVMAAVAGSSAVTASTVGRMSLPELKKRGYSDNLSMGTLAGSGTLGLIIPPSVVFIVYGVLAQQSISKLFMAGILPGLMLMCIFMGYVIIWALLNPKKMPPIEPAVPFLQKLKASRRLFPIILLISAVVGTIYAGIATPTESATFGVIGALILAACSKTLTKQSFIDSLMAATRLSCMIALIIISAAVLSSMVAFVGIPQYLANLVQSWDLSSYMLIFVVTILFIVLGCFLEGMSILVLSSSVILPMLQSAGIDLLWFGVYIVIIIEMAQITPPLGFNLFVLQSLTGKNIFQVTKAAFPFFLLLCLAALLIVIFPEIATYLPNKMSQS